MRNWVWIPLLPLLLLTAAPALCRNGTAEDAITEEEYAIYRLALEEPRGWSEVDNQTLAGVRADDDWLIPPAGIALESELVKSFNKKSSESYQLSDAFLRESAHESAKGRQGRRKTTFSRVGFDKQRRRALLIVGITWYYPEDVMNEGRYVFLEKKGERWTIVDTVRAWNVRLGPIH